MTSKKLQRVREAAQYLDRFTAFVKEENSAEVQQLLGSLLLVHELPEIRITAQQL